MNTRQLQKAFESLWTMQDVKDRFSVTAMTVHNWRKREHDPLPVLSLSGAERPVLRFVRRDVEAWASRNKQIRGRPFGEPALGRAVKAREAAVARLLGRIRKAKDRERVRRPSQGQVAA